MEEFNILVIDDDSQQKKLLEEAISEINEESDLLFKFEMADNPEKAMLELYKNNYQSIIIDLNLKSTDANIKDEEISGNILLNQIIDKEIIPTIIRTGFPEKISERINKNIVEVCTKDDPPLYDIILKLKEKYNESIFKIFGSKGKINKNLKELFWEIMPKCFLENKVEITKLDNDKKEKVLIRYISSWLTNKYMFNEKYEDVEPIEMYMFPNPIEQVCTCDIFKNNDSKNIYLVLTPSCDLANKKTDEVLLCKIQDYKDIIGFNELLGNYKNETSKLSKKAKKAKEGLEKWFRNSHQDSMRYHFLPKVSFFKGGLIDFRSLKCVKYNKENGKLEDEKFEKIGVITEAFKRDIIARFSSYYHRQGQPEFNGESILKNIEED